MLRQRERRRFFRLCVVDIVQDLIGSLFLGLLGEERFQSDWKIVSNAKAIRKRIVVSGREIRCDPEESM